MNSDHSCDAAAASADFRLSCKHVSLPYSDSRMSKCDGTTLHKKVGERSQLFVFSSWHKEDYRKKHTERLQKKTQKDDLWYSA